MRAERLRAALGAFLWLQAMLAAAACQVTGPNLSFGAYDGLSGADATTSGSLVVSCDQSPPPTVTVMIGPSEVSRAFARRLKDDAGSDTLSYNLYVDAASSTVWGDGTGGTAVRSQRVSKTQPWLVTVYGRLDRGQDVTPGSYSDRVTITINY